MQKLHALFIIHIIIHIRHSCVLSCFKFEYLIIRIIPYKRRLCNIREPLHCIDYILKS